ncbi:MAG: GNAT family acetyltransferase [Betaproteobacteria bacterium]|nr:GNAT family acetyltransferase [Betaproteobacteria bacterium]
MHLRQAVGSIRENFERYGLAAAAHDVGCRAVNKVVDLRILRAMSVRVEDVKDPRMFEAPGLVARFAGYDELAKYACDETLDLPEDFLREARARGDRCYAIFDGDTLAAYGWYSNRPMPVDEHFLLQFDARYTYMYKGYTVPAYRGRRLHAVGMCRALRALTDEGRKGLVSWVYSNNFASMQSVLRMGYRVFGTVYLLRAGRLSFARATRSCREYGFRVEPLDTGEALARGAA